ncbi:hypothetical protein N0V90_005590 [Kalmusia sp. IMI 367209]|nr:hypothetical protein N0V90_005590 [Kalmusia sp. IMI 367209]
MAAATPAATTPSTLDLKAIIPRKLGTWHLETLYQSNDIDFGDWITLLTLGLAPIIAHLVAGVPEPGSDPVRKSTSLA